MNAALDPKQDFEMRTISIRKISRSIWNDVKNIPVQMHFLKQLKIRKNISPTNTKATEQSTLMNEIKKKFDDGSTKKQRL